jgi:hypothetical protein
VSPLGAFIKKRSTKIRVIHDLSYPAYSSVNALIDPDSYSLQYSSIDDAAKMLQTEPDSLMFFAKLDLQDAFKFITVNHLDWHLLGFTWHDAAGCLQYYFSRVLNFGLRSAPALFDYFAKPLFQIMLHRGASPLSLRYVDDFLTASNSYDKCEESLQIMLSTARSAGFKIQDSKVIHPTTSIEFLGIIIDANQRQLRISDERLSDLRSELSQTKISKVMTKRQLLSLVGKLAFAAKVVKFGRSFIARLIHTAKQVKYLHYKIKLTHDSLQDIQWWLDCLSTHNGISYIPPPWTESSTLHVYTDASDTAIGARFGNEWYSASYVGSLGFCKQKSINWRELLAATKALASWGPLLTARNVIFHIDNTSVCYALQKLYSPVPDIMELIRTWCSLLEQFKPNVVPVYIATECNIDADDLSRERIASFLQRNPQASSTATWPAPIIFYDVKV